MANDKQQQGSSDFSAWLAWHFTADWVVLIFGMAEMAERTLNFRNKSRVAMIQIDF